MTRIQVSAGSVWLVASALLLVGCGPAEQTAQAPDTADRPLVITGELAYRPRVAVPEETYAVVELRRMNDETAVVAQQRIALQGRQVPVAFELSAEVSDLEEDASYSLHAALLVDGQTLWENEGIEIGARSGVLDLRTLWLERAQVDADSSAASLRCGEQLVSVSQAGERLILVVGQERIAMRQVEAASGARFVAENDPSTIFWSKGDSATLALRGETYPECVLLPKAEDAPDEIVRARGNEPGWMLEITEDALRLELDYGQTRITAPRPSPSREDGLTHYHLRTEDAQVIDVTLRDEICEDNMTGMPYPRAATVMIDGRELRGCAGDPRELLVGEPWVVEDIGAAGIIDRSRVTLLFEADGNISGQGSCNSYRGGYTLTGESLGVSRIAATLMACSPALMTQEQAFFAILEALTRFEIPDSRTLVLHAVDGKTLTARR